MADPCPNSSPDGEEVAVIAEVFSVSGEHVCTLGEQHKDLTLQDLRQTISEASRVPMDEIELALGEHKLTDPEVRPLQLQERIEVVQLTMLRMQVTLQQVDVVSCQSSRFIKGLVFRYSNGQESTHGTTNSRNSFVKLVPFVLNEGEVIVAIFCSMASCLYGLQLETNYGRKSDWFGKSGFDVYELRIPTGFQVWDVEVDRSEDMEHSGPISNIIQRPFGG